jgi:hypothetical protein
MAIIGATELQPVNLLGSYMQGMELGRANQLARQQAAAAQQKAEADQRQAEQNQLMEEAKLREQRGKAMKAETEGLEGRVQYWRRLIPADPRLAPAWVSAAYSDPVVGPELSKMGSAEEVIAGIPRDPDGYMQWVEGASMFADKLAERRTVTAENMLPYKQPLSPEVLNQQLLLRGAGAARSSTTVQLPPSELAYSQTVGKASGEADLAALNAAENAATALAKDYEALDLLRRGQPATGITADLSLQFNRLKAGVAGDKEAVKKVKDTELLNAVLGQDVFANIQALGIGARGLDTPAEREYLREVVSGTISLNQETLIRMAEIRAKIKERAIDKFNKRVESGELDRFFQAAGRPKRGIEKPAALTAESRMSAEDKAALDWANANPRDPRAAQIKQRLGVR